MITIYKELTEIEKFDEKEESPYLCEPCQTNLKFSHNLRRGIHDSDLYLNKIRDKLKNFERVLQSGRPGNEQLHHLKAKIFSNNYCRICFSESSDTFSNVFDTIEYHKKRLTDIYLLILKKHLIPNELSRVICGRCKIHLIRYNETRHKACENDAYVKGLLRESAVPENAANSTNSKQDPGQTDPLLSEFVAPEFIKLEPVEFQAIESSATIVEESFPMPVEIKDEPEDGQQVKKEFELFDGGVEIISKEV